MVEAAHPLIGRTLAGRYRLLGVIGEGAMATVFRAVDVSRQDPFEVAVKVMHPHLADDRTFSGRFRREAQATRMLKHPNSVTIFDVGEDERVHFIAMELVPGRDLRHVLRNDGRLDESRSVRIITGVVEALEAAHQIGIIHRDLKPENVMLVPDPQAPGRERVKVLDFGIAKLLASAPRSRPSTAPDSEPQPLTQVGVVVGTPAYMSPEQCRGIDVDGRSDLYTCGILLYQLVTGRLPFESDSPFEVAGKQAFEPPPPPSQFLPTIVPKVEALVLRLLSKSPDDRPESASELLALLRGLYGELQVRAGRTIPMPAQAVQAALASMAPRRVATTQMLDPNTPLPDPRGLSVAESLPIHPNAVSQPPGPGYPQPGAQTPMPGSVQGPLSGPGPMSGQPMSGQPMSGQPMSGQPMSLQPVQPLAMQPLSAQPSSGPPLSAQSPHFAAAPSPMARSGTDGDRILIPRPHGAGAYVIGIVLAISVGVGFGVVLARFVL